MDFSYKSYSVLLDILAEKGYTICGYHDWQSHETPVILRHDVDLSPDKALEMAEFESSKGIKSTYFFLLSTDFYNPASLNNIRTITKIKNLGHEIGLHFDELKYPPPEGGKNLSFYVINETNILSSVLGFPITAVSMHRPSKMTLEADYSFKDAVNSYSKLFFSEFKYLSDSRRHWREPVMDIVKSGQYKKLHILTHPEWYGDASVSASEILTDFISKASDERRQYLNDNITNLEELTGKDV